MKSRIRIRRSSTLLGSKNKISAYHHFKKGANSDQCLSKRERKKSDFTIYYGRICVLDSGFWLSPSALCSALTLVGTWRTFRTRIRIRSRMSLSSSSLSSQSLRNRLLKTKCQSTLLAFKIRFTTSNADSHRFDADQYFDADPDPATQNDRDPDP